jgi:hypothetical protein
MIPTPYYNSKQNDSYYRWVYSFVSMRESKSTIEPIQQQEARLEALRTYTIIESKEDT